MKKYLLFPALMAIAISGFSQTVVFSDDFESGAANWDIDGYWGVTDEYAYGGGFSFTDSPWDPTYTAGEVQTATMVTSVDLSAALDAEVTFYALIDLEEGFDYMYLDASDDDGAGWINIGVFNGEGMLTDWMPFTFGLGAFVGSPTVKLRFRFEPDFFVEYDGMYIDDFTITSYTTDASPPLILHDVMPLYQGALYENELTATLLDASGISSTSLWYSADGAAYSSVSGVSLGGDDYGYTIPVMDPGTWITYYFTATDAADDLNTATSPEYEIITGQYIGYDDGVIDFVNDIGNASLSGYSQAAVRITLDSFATVVSLVIQNYTDNTRPNDSILIHVWADDAGLPGADLIEPFKLFPEATLELPNKGTRVDLRPYADELEGLIGDIWIGFSSPDGAAWVSQSTPGVALRTYTEFFGTWAEYYSDFHFRAITGPYSGAPNADFTFDASGDPTVLFTDLSTNYPDSWEWDFGDGVGSSTLQNPSYTYTANGDYEVCLTAGNAIGTSTHCETVTIGSFTPPAALFTFDDSADPAISFTDLSTNAPTAWVWTFGDGGGSTVADPSHTYSTNGTFNVCLTASNLAGDDTYCTDVVIEGNAVAPVADYTYSGVGLTVNFTDISTNTPTFWGWDFGDGTSSFDQNPVHSFGNSGVFEVCLTAGNMAGTDESCKTLSVATDLEDLAAAGVVVYPNPATDQVLVNLSDWGGNATLQLYDLQGKLVLQQMMVPGTQVINLTELSSGAYRLWISSVQKTATGVLLVDN